MALALPGTPTAGAETQQTGASASSPQFITFIEIEADDAYETGGTTGLAALVQRAVQKENVDVLFVHNAVHGGSTAGGIAPANAEAVYNPINDRLLVRSYVTGTEATNAADLSSLLLRLWVVYQ